MGAKTNLSSLVRLAMSSAGVRWFIQHAAQGLPQSVQVLMWPSVG